ncbi:MAG: helix-hairpin-helix domain-containing protein [Halobacteriaceae archaeon]
MNDELADLFEEFADRLEARGVEYKPRAYRTAAENIRTHPEDVAALAADGPEAVQGIEGVGEAIAGKVVEYAETGTIEELEAEREKLPVDMPALTAVEGVGPKTVGTLYEELGVTDLDDLEAAAEAGEIRAVEGFGPTSEANIREAVAYARQARERTRLGDARPLAEAAMGALSGVERCEPAGSLRRWRETVGDVDLLAPADDPGAVVASFTDWARADEVIEAGNTRASVRVDGARVDLRVVAPGEFGAALQYFTGSREHNIRLRNRAVGRDLKVNEYGVFDISEVEDEAGQRVGERVAGDTEEGVYGALGLPWIPPELREDRGEIAAAADGDLPDLVEPADIRGDLHVHTDWSDGDLSLPEIVGAAAAFGHDYVCITDHADGPGVPAGVGLSDAELREQADAVAALDADIEVLAGVEANVDAGGELDVADDLLADLDLVIASPHSGLGGDGTDRLVAAVEHPAVDVLGHPTGRLVNERSGLAVDVERVAAAAADCGTALEVNSNPARLDLAGGPVRTALDAGATVAVNTDAHAPPEFAYVEYGVHTARRGWAEAGDVLNARGPEELRAVLE